MSFIDDYDRHLIIATALFTVFNLARSGVTAEPVAVLSTLMASILAALIWAVPIVFVLGKVGVLTPTTADSAADAPSETA